MPTRENTRHNEDQWVEDMLVKAARSDTRDKRGVGGDTITITRKPLLRRLFPGRVSPYEQDIFRLRLMLAAQEAGR